MNLAAFEEEYLVTLYTCQSADWRACTTLICKHAQRTSHQVEDGLNAMLATKVCLSSAHAVAKTNSLEDNPGMGRQSITPCHWNCNRASAKRMIGHEVIAKPRQNASCWQCRERRLGQVGFAHHTFRPRPPSHHTVCDVMKPCFYAVKQNHSDATIFLKGLSSSSRQRLTQTMCLMLSKSFPDETCCFLKIFLLFKQPICAVYTPALHANDKKKQSKYLPQTCRTSMLQAAAARLTVPLQRIRCMTCRYQHHCQLIAPYKYKCSLEFELMQTLSKGTQQVGLLITCRLIIRRQVMTSNIVLSGLLTSNIGMLAAIYTNTHRDCKTSLGYYPLHCVIAA